MTEAAHLHALEGDSPEAYGETDIGLGERFRDNFGHVARFVEQVGRWYVWRGSRWFESDLDALDLAKRSAETLEGALPSIGDSDFRQAARHAAYAASARGCRNALSMAAAEVELRAEPADFDAEPDLLHAPNAVIDLRGGELYRAEPRLMNTKLAGVSYESEATSDLWERVLERALPDAEVREFLQRYLGAGAAGRHVEHLLIAHGTGANSKTTILDAASAALGSYSGTVDSSVLVGKARQRGGDAAPELAQLQGLRLALVAETAASSKLNESQCKNLTGGDRIWARRLYGSPFDFMPSHTFVLQTNYRPEISGQDEGVWRRVLLLPFGHQIPREERDPAVKELLRTDEHHQRAVLAWLVRGAQEFLENGLRVPAKVQAATDGYRSDSDDVARFIEDECVVRPDASVTVAALFEAYERWCQGEGQQPRTKRALGAELDRLGFPAKRDMNTRYRQGLATR